MTSREAAFQILLKFEETRNRLEDLIHLNFQKNDHSPKDKKSIYNLVSGVVRNLSLMDWKISQLFKGNYKKSLNKFKTILRMAFFEIDFQDHIPNFATVNEYVNLAKSKLDKRSVAVVNGILRTYLREKGKYNPEKKFKYKSTQLSVKYSFPEWMIEKWIKLIGEKETEDLCKSFNERPTFDVRINTKNISIQDFEDLLKTHQVLFEKSDYFPNFVKVTNVQKLNQLKLFEQGYCSIQDESAFLISELIEVKMGDKVLDACCAPGGKFTALLERQLNDFTLIGNDKDGERLNVVRQNCKRLGLNNCNLVQSDVLDMSFKNIFDIMLLDAPCSGLGTMQKNPDIKWRRSESEINEFSDLQFNLLCSLSRLIKPKGRIIYSTCTISEEENEKVVQRFLDKHKSFCLVKPNESLKQFVIDNKFIRTFPHKHQMDGSFASILKRMD